MLQKSYFYPLISTVLFIVLNQPLHATEQNLPSATAYSAALKARLKTKLADLGQEYQPRTEHLNAQGTPHYTNRLLFESSPYLRQHAHNPVDWHPWGKDAFIKAAQQDKPIFLSIGYATCHWCHVMEKESFDNVAIAEYLNQHFIAIKVDREQRPDVDAVYMRAVMLASGHGGWPMSSFLLADGAPFFNGTYFAPQQFQQILQKITQLWKEDKPALQKRGAYLQEKTAQSMQNADSAATVGQAAVTKAVEQILAREDGLQGGFSEARKFPNETWLMFLLDVWATDPSQMALQVATKRALDAMLQGGIHDQVGGGFHRYTVDPEWLTPHFEKMLYNQAQLARVYAQAYALSGEQRYADVTRWTLDYVLRDMRDEEHGFYSATDADSAATVGGEAEEGLFFLWTIKELQAVLPEKLAQLAIQLFDVTQAGNFEGENILYLPQGYTEFAKTHQLSKVALLQDLAQIRQILYQVREKRPQPLLDNKVITAWNGMMITSFAEAGRILGERSYIAAAQQAANFIWHHQRDENNHLWRVSLDGETSIAGQLEDYAYTIEAFLSLYDADGLDVWLERAEVLAEVMITQFWDTQHGGFFMTSGDDSTLLIRPKNAEDGAIASSNGVALVALNRLGQRTGKLKYTEKAQQTLSAFADEVQAYPSAYATLLRGAQAQWSGQSGAVRYAAAGAVKIVFKQTAEGIALDFNIKAGWHVNAADIEDKDLIATQLMVDEKQWTLTGIKYPPAKQQVMQFRDKPLALYAGQFTITAKLTAKNATDLSAMPFSVRLQACNETTCLAPETILFYARKSQ